MDLKKVTIIVFDTKANFYSEDTQIQYGEGNFYKDVKRFETIGEFDEIINSLSEDDSFVICCHVNYKDLKGFSRYRNLQLSRSYNFLFKETNFLSSQSSKTVQQDVSDRFNESIASYLYSAFYDKLKLGEIKLFKKSALILEKNSVPDSTISVTKDISELSFLKCDIVVISAIQKEQDPLLEIFDVKRNRKSKTSFHKGTLFYKEVSSNDGSTKRIGFLKQQNMGMIDASILATQIIHDIKPEVIVMTGVCGANPNWEGINFGDIIIPNQSFTFQFGKISNKPLTDNDFVFEPNLHVAKTSDLTSGILAEQDDILTEVKVCILKNRNLKLKIENLNTKVDNDFDSKLKKIDINNLKLFPEFDLACSVAVIDKQGYFGSKIETISRNAIGVEMEAYGIARACELSGFDTKCLIRVC